MPQRYGQYCPFSIAAELLCERWTLLVVSRVIDGCHRFNEIHRGVPRMSPSLLTRRLRELESAGILVRKASPQGGHEYRLTPAGQDLSGLIESMAVWGQAWAREMEEVDLDPEFLVWSMHLRMNVEAMPAGRTVLELSFTGAPPDCTKFWLVARDGEIEMCLKDPELDVDLLVEADLRTFVEAWRGLRDLRHELRTGRIRLTGDEALQRQFPDWLLLSALAPYPRRRAGRERRLARAAEKRREGGASATAR